MNFLTLSVNQPDRILPILGKKESIYGDSYHVVDFCKDESSIDNVINELQSHSMTKWCYIEGNGNG